MKEQVYYDPKNTLVEVSLAKPGDEIIYHKGNYAKYGDKEMKTTMSSLFRQGVVTFKAKMETYYKTVYKDKVPTSVECRYYTYIAEKLPQPYKEQEYLYDMLVKKSLTPSFRRVQHKRVDKCLKSRQL